MLFNASILDKKSAADHIYFFPFFLQKIRYDVSCKFIPPVNFFNNKKYVEIFFLFHYKIICHGYSVTVAADNIFKRCFIFQSQ